MDNSGGIIVWLVLLVFAFVVLGWLPNRQRRKQAERIEALLAPGVQVMTTSGLYGTVVTVEDGDVTLEIAAGVVVKFVKAAVARVVVDPSSEDSVEDSVETEAPEAAPKKDTSNDQD